MLIKPYIKDKATKSASQGSILSLPSESEDSRLIIHPAYFGSVDEIKEFLESEGRLMMLPIMSQEYYNKINKMMHDKENIFNCEKTWAVCTCKFARVTRLYDLGLNNFGLLEVI
jgi:hypothetical protein